MSGYCWIEQPERAEAELKRERIHAILWNLRQELAQAIADNDGQHAMLVQTEIKETEWELETI